MAPPAFAIHPIKARLFTTSTRPQYCSLRRQWIVHTPHRLFSSSPNRKGKWPTIKLDKGRADVNKGRLRTALAAEIIHASKIGGPDPNGNPRLADALVRARKNSLPKANIDAAIARGQGLTTSGAKLESATEEALGPGGVALLIDLLTENRAGTKIELRKVYKLFGATDSNTAFLFDKRGQLVFLGEVDEEKMAEATMDAGGLDFQQEEDGRWTVWTEVDDMKTVGDALKKLGLRLDESEIVWEAKGDMMVAEDSVDQETGETVREFVEKLGDISGVKAVYMNARFAQPLL
ncbi:YebC-like protein [Microthyrium microscopicum]|uniref:YebC-like protein n=1 Tax=Microthyrium microscopicum TaxID=703497 RepID=A0A6A6TXP7_9PEZI|nr:YebC-like protein [Microthyrium microscopicum]